MDDMDLEAEELGVNGDFSPRIMNAIGGQSSWPPACRAKTCSTPTPTRVAHIAFLSRYEETEEQKATAETYRLVAVRETDFLPFVRAWAQ